MHARGTVDILRLEKKYYLCIGNTIAVGSDSRHTYALSMEKFYVIWVVIFSRTMDAKW